MKFGRLLVLCFVLSPTGCFYGYGIQNTVSSPLDTAQECLFRYRVRQLARDFWRKLPRDGDKKFSADYVQGFEDGFVDYVDAGGNGEPPAIPPNRRRRALLRSDEGEDKIEDWYDGFRHGAHVARASGLRELALMPIARPPLTPTEPYPAQVVVPVLAVPKPFVPPAPAVAPGQAVVPAPFVAPAPPVERPSERIVPAPAVDPTPAVALPNLPIFTGRSEPVASPPSLGFVVIEN